MLLYLGPERLLRPSLRARGPARLVLGRHEADRRPGGRSPGPSGFPAASRGHGVSRPRTRRTKGDGAVGDGSRTRRRGGRRGGAPPRGSQRRRDPRLGRRALRAAARVRDGVRPRGPRPPRPHRPRRGSRSTSSRSTPASSSPRRTRSGGGSRRATAVTIRAVRPALDARRSRPRAHGEALWSRDPDRCCAIRKVEPLREALRGHDAWISAIRRDQTRDRAGARGGRARRAATGSSRSTRSSRGPRDDVWAYLREHDVPVNPLHAARLPEHRLPAVHRRPSPPGEDPRAGRWRGREKTECGLHARPRRPAPNAALPYRRPSPTARLKEPDAMSVDHCRSPPVRRSHGPPTPRPPRRAARRLARRPHRRGRARRGPARARPSALPAPLASTRASSPTSS